MFSKWEIFNLENKDYQTEVKKIIQNIKNMEETSIQKWENLKYEVKNFSISFSINSQKKIKDQIRNIEKEISNMETLPYSMIDMNKKRDLESQLNILYDKKATGAQIRSRAKWINEGEKNTKFFLGLKKNIKHRISFGNSQTKTTTF